VNATRACNLQATVSPATRQGNELSIAINPRNPQNILVTAKDYTPDYAGQCTWDGIYATVDGGRTWKDQNVPGSPWKRLQDPSEPLTPVSTFYCATDPVVAFGPDGTAYWAVQPYQCDPLSGSKTGEGVIPANPVSQATGASNGGGLNDWLWTCSSYYVLTSTDGGLTWPVDRIQQVAFGPRLEHDKGWISVAPDNTALLCWDHAPPSGTVLAVAGAQPPDIPNAPPVDNAIVCSQSKDQGKTWSAMTDMNQGWAGAYTWIDHDADNVAYDASVDGTNVIVSRSKDGVAWEKPSVVGPYKDPPPNADAYGFPGLKNSKFRVFTVPSLAVDRSRGPYGGSVYVTWMTYNTTKDEADVVLSASHDGGKTWSAPALVHDDDPARQTDHFMPAVSVGPDGTVDVSWYDRRVDPQNHLIDVFSTYSVDGGRTFARNLRVTDASFDEQYSHHQNGAVFLGDYRQGASSAGASTIAWVDTRNHKADVYVATIERPGANPPPGP
jgi:hypothetical protein